MHFEAAQRLVRVDAAVDVSGVGQEIGFVFHPPGHFATRLLGWQAILGLQLSGGFQEVQRGAGEGRPGVPEVHVRPGAGVAQGRARAEVFTGDALP